MRSYSVNGVDVLGTPTKKSLILLGNNYIKIVKIFREKILQLQKNKEFLKSCKMEEFLKFKSFN